MIAAIKGFVSKVETYKGKDGAEDVEMVHVAAGEYMMRVPSPADDSFEVMDVVLVAGELAVFEKRPYIKAGWIRHATADDLEFFRRATNGAPIVTDPVGEDGGVVERVTIVEAARKARTAAAESTTS